MTNPDVGDLMGRYNECLAEIEGLRTRIYNGCGAAMKDLLEWISSSGIKLRDVHLPEEECTRLTRELADAVRRKRILDEQLHARGLGQLVVWL